MPVSCQPYATMLCCATQSRCQQASLEKLNNFPDEGHLLHSRHFCCLLKFSRSDSVIYDDGRTFFSGIFQGPRDRGLQKQFQVDRKNLPVWTSSWRGLTQSLPVHCYIEQKSWNKIQPLNRGSSPRPQRTSAKCVYHYAILTLFMLQQKCVLSYFCTRCSTLPNNFRLDVEDYQQALKFEAQNRFQLTFCQNAVDLSIICLCVPVSHFTTQLLAILRW